MKIMEKLELMWGIPVFEVQEKGDGSRMMHSFGTFLENGNPLYLNEELVGILLTQSARQKEPVVYFDGNRVYFACVRTKMGCYVTGPLCMEQLDYRELSQYYEAYRIPKEFRKHPPRRRMAQLLNFLSLLYEICEGISLDLDSILTANHLGETDSLQSLEEETARKESSREAFLEEEERRHHTYQEERYVMECIREGQPNRALQSMDALVPTVSTLSDKPMNHYRNLAIISVAMATREAIAGGVAPFRAYQLSDLLVQKIDKCMKIDQLQEYQRKSVYQFAKLVEEVRQAKSTSSYAEQCKDYINKNYRTKISLEDMAEDIGITPEHLSRTFRKDTGMRIQDYIQKTRINRAANLLKYSEASLDEISYYLNFHSQSHFGRVFKKYMQMTPKQYRDTHKKKEFI